MQWEQLNASLYYFSSPFCFSNWPRRCCFFQRKRRKRAWQGSLWWHLISLQDSPTYNCNPTLYKRKQQHRSASGTQACFQWETPGSNLLVAPAVARNQTRIVWRIDMILLWRLFSWSSPLCACIIIFLNRALRSEKMRCLTKGKKHLLQSVKPWSDQSATR